MTRARSSSAGEAVRSSASDPDRTLRLATVWRGQQPAVPDPRGRRQATTSRSPDGCTGQGSPRGSIPTRARPRGVAASASARPKCCNDDPMSLVLDCVLIDCVDLEVMTSFWCQALDLEQVWTGPSGGHLLTATDGSGRRLALMPSHSTKAAKNRVHFDLRPDRPQQVEVRRLEGLGARRIDIGQVDVTWVVMADPEGNEFCVLRSLAEKEKGLALNGG